MTGLNLMDKNLLVQGAQISFSIWDVGGIYIYIHIHNMFLINLLGLIFWFEIWLQLMKVIKFLCVLLLEINVNAWFIGDKGSQDHVPIACKDAVAILYMFDLTSRCTLNRFVSYYIIP